MPLEVQQSFKQMDNKLPQILCTDLLTQHLGKVIDKREESVWFVLLCPFPQKSDCLHKLISYTYNT